MIAKNTPNTPNSRGVGYAVGFIFFIVGISLFGSGNAAGGFTFLILGVVFLLSGQPGLNAKKTRPGAGGFPPEAQTWQEKADEERQSWGQELGPDGNRKFPAQTPSASMREPRVRENKAPSERQLWGQALAPDGNSVLPVQKQQKSTARGFDVHMTADDIDRRGDELKGLLESGIITRDEYRDRLNKLQ